MPHPWFSMRVIHPDAEACEALRERFEGVPQVEVECARYEDLRPHDCFVTAGNAFGVMSAGIDAAVVHRFGRDFMARVQDHIMEAYLGEQPVGTAFLIETGDAERPWICHAPTMRTPTSINNTSHIYTATFASLVHIHRHNVSAAQPIESVVFPAMGTGFGQVSHSECGRQMAVAWQHYRHPPGHPTWDTITRRERAICYDGKEKVVRL
ncbi:MAG: macro domain-containing protein [Myxococcota bacterium]